MGAFGGMAPRRFAPSFTDFNPDPGASSSGPPLTAPITKPAAMPPHPGLFGGLRKWLTPERLAIIGAGLRQAGGVNGALDDTLRLQMEAARQQTEDAVRQRLMDHQTVQWKQDDAQQQRLDNWAQTQGGDALVDPETAYRTHQTQDAQRDQYAWQRNFDNTNPEAITPAQRAQLDLQARGQTLDYLGRSPAPVQLRGADRQLMEDIQAADQRTQSLMGLGQTFLDGNGRLGTGNLSNGQPLAWVGAIGSPDAASMDAASANMRSYMRPPGSGATSDYEQRLYGLGAMSRDRTGPQNQAIGRAYEVLGRLNRARRFFYEDYAQQNGSLLGAEQAFQNSPEYQGVLRQNPLSSFGAARPAGASASAAPRAAAGGGEPTADDIRAELARRERERRNNSVSGNQPGGYRGR